MSSATDEIGEADIEDVHSRSWKVKTNTQAQLDTLDTALTSDSVTISVQQSIRMLLEQLQQLKTM